METEFKMNSSYLELVNTYSLCENLISSGELEDSQKIILDKIEDHPDDLMFRYLSGKIYLIKNENEKAKAVFEDIIQMEPDFYLARNDLAILCYNIGECEKAIEYLKYAIEKNNYNYDIIRNYADILKEKSDFVNALKLYIRILKEFKNDIEVLIIMAELSIEAEKYDDAELYINKVLIIDDKNIQALEIKNILENYCVSEMLFEEGIKKKLKF